MSGEAKQVYEFDGDLTKHFYHFGPVSYLRVCYYGATAGLHACARGNVVLKLGRMVKNFRVTVVED
jgi:hypothetical protein